MLFKLLLLLRNIFPFISFHINKRHSELVFHYAFPKSLVLLLAVASYTVYECTSLMSNKENYRSKLWGHFTVWQQLITFLFVLPGTCHTSLQIKQGEKGLLVGQWVQYSFFIFCSYSLVPVEFWLRIYRVIKLDVFSQYTDSVIKLMNIFPVNLSSHCASMLQNVSRDWWSSLWMLVIKDGLPIKKEVINDGFGLTY